MRKLKNNQEGMGIVELLLLLLLIIILALVGWYVWKTNQDSKKSSQSSYQQPAATKKTATKTKTTTPTPVCTDPSSSVVENVQASVSSGNTAALEGYMATGVNVEFAPSEESIGVVTPTQAVTAITSFIGDPTTTTWDFSLSASVLSSYGKGSYKTYFPNNAVVGKSSTDKVISFNFDCKGKINVVFEAAKSSLL